MNISRQYTWLENEGKDSAAFKYVLPSVRDKKVLDLGCGTGVYLSKFGDGSIGVDFSIPNLKKICLRNLTGVRADLDRRLPFRNGSFEAVFCSHVLEHVVSPLELLREASRVLKHEGIIIIALPVERSLARIVLGDHYFWGHPTHLYGFSLEGVKRLLSFSGFKYQIHFIDLPGVRKIRSLWMLDLFQKLPFFISRRIASNLWIIGKNEK